MAQTAAKLAHKHHGDFIRRSRGEIVVQLIHKVLKQADKKRVLIFVPRVYCAGGDPGFLGDLVERSLLIAAGKELLMCRPRNAAVKRMISVGYDFRLLQNQ